MQTLPILLTRAFRVDWFKVALRRGFSDSDDDDVEGDAEVLEDEGKLVDGES